MMIMSVCVDPPAIDMEAIIRNMKFVKQVKIKNHLPQNLICKLKVRIAVCIHVAAACTYSTCTVHVIIIYHNFSS